VGVDVARAALFEAARLYARTGESDPLIRAAEQFSRARNRNRDARDRWKERKRLGAAPLVKK